MPTPPPVRGHTSSRDTLVPDYTHLTFLLPFSLPNNNYYYTGRQQQGGLLVAATRLPRQGGAIFDDLVSGLCGPGYLAAAVGGIEWPPLPTSPTAAASAPYCLSLWLYSKQTRRYQLPISIYCLYSSSRQHNVAIYCLSSALTCRWRSTCMDITASSSVTAFSSAATVSSNNNNNNNNNKSLPYSGATLLDGRGDEAAAARRAVNCALTASFSLSWFEDHSRK